MTRDEIISMAREAGVLAAQLLHQFGTEGALCDSEIRDLRAAERLAQAAYAAGSAAEREACAQVCVDAIASIRGFGTEDAKQIGINVCANLAAAIRARSIT